VAFDPKVASAVLPIGANRDEVPMQTGFVKFGGTSCKVELPVSASNEIMPTGMLYPSTSEIS
jgi:hypothetical protein